MKKKLSIHFLRWGMFVVLVGGLVVLNGCDSSRSKSDSNDRESENQQSSSDTSRDTSDGIPVDERLTRAFSKLPVARDPGTPIQLVYKPKSGSVWRYKIDSNMAQEFVGATMNQKGVTDIEIRINSIADDSFEVTSRIVDTISTMDTPGGSLHLNTVEPEKMRADPPFRSFMDVWEAVLSADATFNVNRNGLIVDFKIPEKIMDAIHTGEERQTMGLTEESFSSNFVSCLLEFPASPVSLGDQWEVKNPSQFINTTDNVQTGRLLGTAIVDGTSCALVEFSAQTSGPDENPIVIEFESSVVSLVLFDMEAGNILKIFSVSEIESQMNVNDSSIQQNSTVKGFVTRVDNE